MAPLDEFKKEHGAGYLKVLGDPHFQAALLFLNIEKLNAITILKPEEIKENGSQILADLAGHLKHENNLMTLLDRRTFDPSELPAETYGAEASLEQDAPTDEEPSPRRRKKRTRT